MRNRFEGLSAMPRTTLLHIDDAGTQCRPEMDVAPCRQHHYTVSVMTYSVVPHFALLSCASCKRFAKPKPAPDKFFAVVRLRVLASLGPAASQAFLTRENGSYGEGVMVQAARHQRIV